MAELTIYIKLLGGWIFAACLAIANHFFFAYLDGKDAKEYSDILITAIKNAIATAAQLALVYVQVTSLVQLTWYFIRNKEISIKKLNVVFGLPGILNFLELLFHPSFLLFLPLILLALLALLMPLIPIFVPAALSIKAASASTATFLVPSLDLSANYSMDIGISTRSSQGGQVLDLGASPRLRQVVGSTLGFNSPLSWSPPSGCGVQCDYLFHFEGIAPQCSDLDSSQISNDGDPVLYQAHLRNGQKFGRWYFYNASLVYGVNPENGPPFTFVIAYLDSRFYANTSVLLDAYAFSKGTSCTFHNATYSVSASFSTSQQLSQVTKVEIHSPPLLYDLRSCVNTAINGYYYGTPCINTMVNTKALITAFSEALYGDTEMVQQVGFRANVTYATSLFTMDLSTSGWRLTDHAERLGLSRATEQLFHNLTLSVLSSTAIPQSNLVEVQGGVTPSVTQYKYNPFQLLFLYSVYLVLVGISVVIGIYALRQNGAESKNEFSSFLVATRNPGLDGVARREKTEMEGVKLKYSDGVVGRVFTVVSGVENGTPIHQLLPYRY